MGCVLYGSKVRKDEEARGGASGIAETRAKLSLGIDLRV